MRILYDTTNVPATVIPANAQLVAGYIDGHYRSFDAVVARCPNAVHVPIAVFPSTNGGQVLDCEQGDARPDQCPAWIKMRKAAGVFRPTIYTLASQVGTVKSYCANAGLVFNVDWDLWVAHYDGQARPDGYGEVAKQYIDHGPNGENYDMSAVFDDNWPHLSPIIPPTRPLEASMATTEFKRRVLDDGTFESYTDETGTFPFVYDCEAKYVNTASPAKGLVAFVDIVVGPSSPAHNGQPISVWSGTAGQIAHNVSTSAYYSHFFVQGPGRQSVVSQVPLDAWVDTVILPT